MFKVGDRVVVVGDSRVSDRFRGQRARVVEEGKYCRIVFEDKELRSTLPDGSWSAPEEELLELDWELVVLEFELMSAFKRLEVRHEENQLDA